MKHATFFGFQQWLTLVSLTILLTTISCCHSPNDDARTVSKRLLLNLEGNTGSVTSLALSPDGKWIASSHCEQPGRTDSENPRVAPSGERARFNALRELKIWDAQSAKEQISIKEQGPTSAIAFFPDSRRLAGAVGKDIKLWDTTTGQEVLILKGHDGVIHGLDLNQNGDRIVTGSSDGTIKIWDAVRGTCLHTLPGNAHEVFHVSFNPDAKRVAITVREDKLKRGVRIWDIAAGKEVLSLNGPDLIGKVVFSPQGRFLAGFSNEATKSSKPGFVEVWDSQSGKLLFAQESHSAEVTCIAYSSDGRCLATGSKDGTVVIRNASTGEGLLTLVAHRKQYFNGITSIAFSADGNRLVAASWNGTITIWDVKDLCGTMPDRPGGGS